MISLYHFQNSLPVFQALSSETRIRIIQQIHRQEGITVKQLSRDLNIPMSTLAQHITILEKCGLINTLIQTASRGTQKSCFLGNADQLMILFDKPKTIYAAARASVPVGSYASFDISPTCGLASPMSFLGQLDDPRYFAHPQHMQADILWFSAGYIDYYLPNFIPRGSIFDSLSVSFEISSEAPRHNNNWPSDISFSLNDTKLGIWTSPGDYGDRCGKLNPDWWYPFLNQYGLLKTIRIDHSGTYLDDTLLSEETVDSLSLTDQSVLKFRFAVVPGENERGLTIYGGSFGDYSQGIEVQISYHTEEQRKPT